MQVLLNWIEKTLENMRDRQSEAGFSPNIMASLRELQLSINPLMLAKVDRRTKFISFFLNSFIDSTFMDLLGDIPDDRDGILEAIRQGFFERVVSGFAQLLESSRGNSDPLPALESLVDAYTEAVRELNYKDIQIGGVR